MYYEVTVIAQLVPINIGGVVVTRANLYNQDEIERKDIREGDVVVVARAGDVIPKIVEVDKSARSRNAPKFVFPDTCPECDSDLDDWERCTGENVCPAQQIGKLKYFVSNDAFDITGFGDKQLEFFYNLGLVKQIPDIFTLEEKLKNFNLSEQKGWGEKLISNLLNSINSRRTMTLDRFISSLGIQRVGPYAAKLIAKHYQSYDSWYEAVANDTDQLISINGIGEETADSIWSFFLGKDNVEMVNDLAAQLNILPVVANTSNSIFNGKTVVFTGKLSKMERKEAQALMESLGGIVSSSVSNKTDFLVVGEKPGSKYKRAVELGVKILTEEKFNKLILGEE